MGRWRAGDGKQEGKAKRRGPTIRAVVFGVPARRRGRSLSTLPSQPQPHAAAGAPRTGGRRPSIRGVGPRAPPAGSGAGSQPVGRPPHQPGFASKPPRTPASGHCTSVRVLDRGAWSGLAAVWAGRRGGSRRDRSLGRTKKKSRARNRRRPFALASTASHTAQRECCDSALLGGEGAGSRGAGAAGAAGGAGRGAGGRSGLCAGSARPRSVLQLPITRAGRQQQEL